MMATEINKFPFTERSTLKLTNLEYTMPLAIFMDANFYPVCQNNAPFHVSDFIKQPDSVVVKVADNTNTYIFDIIISYTVASNGYCTGIGVQNNRYCGSCLCSASAVDFFDSIPSILGIDSDSLVFTASAVRPIQGDSRTTGYVKYDGVPVETITWGNNLDDGTVITNVIELAGEKEQPINTVVVNNVELTGKNLFITPVKQGVIRVINSSDILIGRLTDL